MSSIESNGGILTSNISKNTHAIIVKNISDTSSKINKAKALKIPIYTPTNFVKSFIS